MIKKYILPAVGIFTFISLLYGGWVSIKSELVWAEDLKETNTTMISHYLEFQIERYLREKENIRRDLREYRKDYGRDMSGASNVEREDYDELKERFGHVVRKVEGLQEQYDDHLLKVMKGE